MQKYDTIYIPYRIFIPLSQIHIRTYPKSITESLPNKFHFCRNGTKTPPLLPVATLYLYRAYFSQIPFYIF